MGVELSNSILSVRIEETGAELKSLKEQSTGVEYIWQSDPAWWTGAAPILFPIIGGLKNDSYTYKGQTYTMPSHGLVRKKKWDFVSSDATSATFQTESDAETLKQYPFEYLLKVTYTLEANKIAVRYEVINKGKEIMYFSLGSHPAFNVPFAGGHLENYYFHFSEGETVERHFLEGGLHTNRTEPIFDNSRQIFLSPTLFDNAALIFKNPKSKCVSFKNSRNSKEIKVITEGMPFLGLWGPSGAPFACIEPWHGITDGEDADGDLTKKEGIMTVDAGSTYKNTYWIEIK
jgi:galactose mutarotase-like enzyme